LIARRMAWKIFEPYYLQAVTTLDKGIKEIIQSVDKIIDCEWESLQKIKSIESASFDNWKRYLRNFIEIRIYQGVELDLILPDLDLGRDILTDLDWSEDHYVTSFAIVDLNKTAREDSADREQTVDWLYKLCDFIIEAKYRIGMASKNDLIGTHSHKQLDHALRKIHYRLNRYSILMKVWFEYTLNTRLVDGSFKDGNEYRSLYKFERDLMIFDNLDLRSELVQMGYSEEEICDTCRDILKEIDSSLPSRTIREMKILKFIERYFENQNFFDQLQKIGQDYYLQYKKSYEQSDWYDCLRMLGIFFPNVPYSFSSTIFTENIKPANQYEINSLLVERPLNLINHREELFATCFINDAYFESDREISTERLQTRREALQIFKGVYAPVVEKIETSLISFITAVEEIIDEKWQLIKSKRKRGIYYDEWGVLHAEGWDKEFSYFVEQVINQEIFNFDPLFLILEIPDSYEYLGLSSSGSIIANIGLARNVDELLKLIREGDEDSYEYLKLKWLKILCAHIISVRLILEEIDLDEDSDIIGMNEHFNEVKTSSYEDSESITQCGMGTQNIGVDYEYLIKEQLEDLGFKITMTPSTGDQGVDLIATRNGKKLAIQCKFYTAVVGNKAIQEIISGRLFYDCDYACVVTNSSFTTSASQLAHKANVILCAHDELAVLNSLM